jgi:SpoVK/Ycf46/Vps4 family AAA+-type ATPase
VSPDRDPLPEMLQRLHARATWDDLVLPDAVTRQLRAIAQQARRRKRATERSSKPAFPGRPPGRRALFSGPSGTGKTMAAEVLATALHFDLFRVDLTAVVSKYIGETEKNLRRLFDAVNAPDVILVFDEADALFGLRSEVKDSHDHYANLEVAYLLQRLEQHAGLTILTTNQRHAIDPAFMRRFHVLVDFPLPDDACRESIWRRIFPSDGEIERLDYRRLARLEITGGTIRDIATRAALRAAAQATPITMPLILEAASAELRKLGRILDAEDA